MVVGQKLASVVSAHAWRSDASQLAISPNTNEVHVYETPDRYTEQLSFSTIFRP